MIPENVTQLFHKIIKASGASPCTIDKISKVGGGDINHSVKIDTSGGEFFMKYNNADLYPQMFKKEATGLRLLNETGEINVPTVIGFAQDETHAVLLLKFINSGRRVPNFFEDFGQSLARMHNHHGEYFGLDHDNYIGSLPQSNRQHADWINFFVSERLEKQVAMALDNNRIDNATVKKFESLYSNLEDFFPGEKPSLLHGDLWSGNYMVSEEGTAYIYDPAVYYGHRLMDLGMSKLFGGFDPAFYTAYNLEHPLQDNWREAIDICNLYPLMVHVNLFGSGYLNSVKSILARF